MVSLQDSNENIEQDHYTEQEVDESKGFSQRQLRSIMFHFLYAMDSFNYEVELPFLVEQFSRGFELEIPSESEVLTKTQAIVDEREFLDNELEPLLANWRLERLSVITRLILRMALWELKHSELAPSIVINEAIEMAKCFGETDSYRLVNGVLDEWINIHEPLTSEVLTGEALSSESSTSEHVENEAFESESEPDSRAE